MQTATPSIGKIRSFHRTVTQRIGALSNRYLGRDRPLAESRLLFEIGRDGAEVRALRERLSLDSGFLSRMLRGLESQKLIQVTTPADDGRVRFAKLTRSGRAELDKLDELSDGLAQSILAPLSRDQGEKLVAAMAEVERLLRASAVQLSIEDPTSREAVWCRDQYYQELDARFGNGFDPNLSQAAENGEITAPRGYLLVARLFGQPVGCGALRIPEKGVGNIKRMWVAPEARGLGIARRMLGELERLARTRRLKALRLDTNESLQEAQALYRSSGYAQIEAFNDDPYASFWFEKRLR